jgi:succinyl-CoA synthetase beta subunit
MKLYEYQAKDVFAKAGIPVPRSRRIESASEAAAAAGEIGLPCMIKAQVLHGGRGKAGLIRSAETAEEAASLAEEILAKIPAGGGVLIEERVALERELYLSVTLDPTSARVLMMASASGGVDIEALAEERPEAIARVAIHPNVGLMPFHVRNLAAGLGLDKEAGKAFGGIAKQLFTLFRSSDATLAEINPLALTADGTLVAADAKLILDDNAAYRQPFERAAESYADDVEREAADLGIPLLRFDGDIGLMCAGAGLTNTIFDLIHDFGGRPANFLEFGGPNYRRAKEAMTLALKCRPKVLLIVTFGTIARADVMAEGVVEAMKELQPECPIVTAIRGTNEEDATRTLREAGLDPLSDTEEAVRRAIELAKGDRS